MDRSKDFRHFLRYLHDYYKRSNCQKREETPFSERVAFQKIICNLLLDKHPLVTNTSIYPLNITLIYKYYLGIQSNIYNCYRRNHNTFIVCKDNSAVLSVSSGLYSISAPYVKIECMTSVNLLTNKCEESCFVTFHEPTETITTLYHL